MKFLIVAIDHGWQYVPYGDETPESAALKTKYQTLLTKAVADRGIDLICEESDPCRLSIAQKVAYEHKPRIRWENINMSAQERLEAGIWEALLHRPQHTIEEPPGSGYLVTIDHRVPEDEIREQFFIAESLEAAECVGSKSILILCGDMHAEFVREVLEARGIHADRNHELIPVKHWQ
jgi:hypothetical protein